MKNLKDIKLFLFDLDGTLYLGKDLFPFTIPLLSAIREQGKDYVFVTNNSSRSLEGYVKRMEGFGIRAKKRDFVSSPQVTGDYLFSRFGNGKVFVGGTRAFIDELKFHGVNAVTEISDDLSAVCIGFDTEFTYEKLENLSKILCNFKDIPYIAANPDKTCPMDYGAVPDCGALADALYYASGRRPVFIGKPKPEMIFYAMKNAGVNADETLVIGDRLYTDIASGVNAGVHTLLVLSGEAKREDIGTDGVYPEFVMDDCSELLKIINE